MILLITPFLNISINVNYELRSTIYIERGALWSIKQILSKIKTNLSHWIFRLDGCDHNIRATLLTGLHY